MAQAPIPKGSYVNTPANSFSSGDILRIIANNTTRDEKIHILYFFLVVVPITGFLTDVIQAIALLFKPTKLLFKIMKFLGFFDEVMQRINPLDASLLLMFLPEEPRKEAQLLLKKLKRSLLVD